MTDDLVKWLRNTPNWKREEYGVYKSAMVHYDRAPFEAADRIEELEDTLSLRTNLHGEATYLIHRLEAKLAKAMEAIFEAIYLLDPDEEDIAKGTGLYRIVTTFKELKGQDDAVLHGD